MLPSALESKVMYLNSREFRNRMREKVLKHLGGDMEAFRVDQLDALASDAECELIHEQADFMREQDMLTPEISEALENLYGWAKELQARCEVAR